MSISLITPTEVVRLAPLAAISPAEIPGDDAGSLSDVTHTLASTGVILPAGYPVDAIELWVKVVTPGDLGVMRFRVSRTLGVNYGSVVETATAPSEFQTAPYVRTPEWRYEVPLSGVLLRFQNGSGTPNSFLVDDIYKLTTTASPRMLDHCEAASDEYAEWARNSNDNPRLDVPTKIAKVHMASVIRWRLTLGRGLDEMTFKAQLEAYKQGVTYFERRSDGTLRAEVVKDTVSVQGFVQPRNPLCREFPI